MNDALFEERLREAFDHLPLPTEDVTKTTRGVALDVLGDGSPRPTRGRRGGRRLLAAAAGLATLGVLAGFAMGRTLAPERTTTRTEAAPLSATGGPGFLPAGGWNTAQTGTSELPQAATALATTVEIVDTPGDNPRRTVSRLGPDDVLIQAAIYGREGFRPALDRAYPPLKQPLRLDQGVAQRDWEGGSGLRYVITGRVDGWLVEAIAYFGSAEPGGATRRRADEQLGRLILPSPCPGGAQPLPSGGLDEAAASVRAQLFVGVDRAVKPPADYGKPAITARAAAADDAVPAACRTVPHDRIVVVDVRFPALRDRPELGHQTYLVSRQDDGYVVWERVR
jgi:hypothetical protein